MTQIPDRFFTRSQLPHLGITDRQLRRWLEAGLVRRVLHGVYAHAAVPDTLETRAEAASLILPRHAVVVDRSAAWLHGIDALEPSERGRPPRLEVVSVGGAQASRRREFVGGKRDLAAHDIVSVCGVRVTTPLRTAMDLACLRGDARALAVLDAFMRHCGLCVQDFQRALPRFKGRRGVTQVRRLAPLASALAESPGESWCRMAILRDGLPAPMLQWEIAVDGRVLWRLDHAYPEWRIAVEYDGEEFHGPEHAVRDQRRRAWLAAHGWHVIVVRKEDLAGERLSAWLDELRAVIRERSAVAKRRYAREAVDRQWRR
ncbi:type IV toxin-antitoxin system AbiEi family antitoxin domain-containing protein [Nocardioides limicola]|uniref:type IV toxin-antitoxin system AbiEi family antitoxin domain-containing protein n=1 Tax=Nocardioides limicola TaxID=2803368 RepID=UPI00193C7192|nr:type IV toxin-antitoxin system AbiEi family antitoxin domain-containing protein [Nocardioides sp. DJM-14]